MRASIIVFAGIVLGFALYSNASIFKMVENAYKITLAGAFVPLFFGAFWKRATTQGALAAIFGGLSSWILVEVLLSTTGESSGQYAYALAGAGQLVPPQLIGLGVSIVGMIVGSLLPQWIGRRLPHEDIHEALHHRAAAETHHATEHPHHH
jgi:Na+/proline symporter